MCIRDRVRDAYDAHWADASHEHIAQPGMVYISNPTEDGTLSVSYTHLDVYKRQLYGIFTIITYYSGFRAGFCFSAGATDLVFSASLPCLLYTSRCV